MSYKELLAKIDEAINNDDIWLEKLAWKALRAVVELCNTAINGKPNTDYSIGYVAACERIIQAIEKELG